MKILQLSPLFGPLVPEMKYGSVERVIMNLDREYVSMGHESLIVAREGSHIKGQTVNSGSEPNYEKQSEIAIDYLLNNEVDVLHVHRSDFLLSDAFKQNFRKITCPILATFHGPAETKYGLYKDYSRVAKLYINALSYFQASGLSRVFDIAAVIHNGVDKNLYEVKTERDDFLFTFGRITKDKGQDVAVRVAKKLGMKLIMGGVILNDEDKNYFDEEIEPFVDEKTIKFVGPLNDQQKLFYLQNTRAVLMPICWDDPCPLVAIESMACGAPVVAYGRGSLPEIVRDKETGFVVDNFDSMVEAVKTVDTIDSQKCHERFLKYFSSEIMAKKYIDLYEKMVQNR